MTAETTVRNRTAFSVGKQSAAYIPADGKGEDSVPFPASVKRIFAPRARNERTVSRISSSEMPRIPRRSVPADQFPDGGVFFMGCEPDAGVSFLKNIL